MDRENPWAEVGALQEWFERQQRQARQGRWPAMGRWTPQLDVLEGDDAYSIRLAVPGVRPDDVQITVEQNVVTVSGELRQQEPEGGARYLHQEREGGHFTRSIALPGMVDPDQTRATFEHGVVTIALPKHAATRPRRIAVQATGGGQTAAAPAADAGGAQPAEK